MLLSICEDPAGFFDEAGRVAKSGLFIAPNAIAEQIYSHHFHLWLIEQKEDKLYFAAKKQAIVHPKIHHFFVTEVLETKAKLDDFTLDHWETLLINYGWTGKPECVVEGKPTVLASDGFVQASTDEPVVTHRPSGVEALRVSLKKWVRLIIHQLFSNHRQVDWADILACPKCHGDVSITETNVHCSTCKLCFPIEQNIPIMLLEHAVGNTG